MPLQHLLHRWVCQACVWVAEAEASEARAKLFLNRLIKKGDPIVVSFFIFEQINFLFISVFRWCRIVNLLENLDTLIREIAVVCYGLLGQILACVELHRKYHLLTLQIG